MTDSPRSADFLSKVQALFDSAGIARQQSSRMLIGVQGTASIEGRMFTVKIAPLRKSRYVGAERVGATTVGYRLEIETASTIPVRFSVMHQGITGSRLIAWVNKLKGIYPVAKTASYLEAYPAWSNDTHWAEELLSRDYASVAIYHLLQCEPMDARIGHPCVFIFPTSIQYYRRAATLDGFGRLAEYIPHFASLTQAANENSPPTRVAKPSLLERMAKNNPVLAGGLAVLCILLFFSAMFGGIFWLIMM